MAGRSSLIATAGRALSQPDVRSEADRARAVLPTLRGWTSLEIAEVSEITADAMRHWLGRFSGRGVDAAGRATVNTRAGAARAQVRRPAPCEPPADVFILVPCRHGGG